MSTNLSKGFGEAFEDSQSLESEDAKVIDLSKDNVVLPSGLIRNSQKTSGSYDSTVQTVIGNSGVGQHATGNSGIGQQTMAQGQAIPVPLVVPIQGAVPMAQPVIPVQQQFQVVQPVANYQNPQGYVPTYIAQPTQLPSVQPVGNPYGQFYNQNGQLVLSQDPNLNRLLAKKNGLKAETIAQLLTTVLGCSVPTSICGLVGLLTLNSADDALARGDIESFKKKILATRAFATAGWVLMGLNMLIVLGLFFGSL